MFLSSTAGLVGNEKHFSFFSCLHYIMSVLLPILKLTHLAFLPSFGLFFVVVFLTFHEFSPHKTASVKDSVLPAIWTGDGTNSPVQLHLRVASSALIIKYSYYLLIYHKNQDIGAYCK